VRVRDSLMPSWLPPVMKRVVNPVQGLWAPWLPPWALVVHRGRKSGTEYRTPVLAWRSGSTLYVSLYYGERAQWVRNVLAGGGTVVRRGRRREIAGARVVRDAPLPRMVTFGQPVLAIELSARSS
jgi:deazaflavin-dependent oxidoreductase (nitroreductase family)